MLEKRWAAPDRYALLKEFALENRKHATVAEDALWQCLRAKKLGAQFLRQYIIDEFIVDFVCRDNGVIIEIDGGYHSEPRQQQSDAERTERLESLGFRVLRFTNDEVLFETEYVLESIKKYCNL